MALELNEEYFSNRWFEENKITEKDKFSEMLQAYDEDFFLLLKPGTLDEIDNLFNDFLNFLDANHCDLPNTYYYFSGEELTDLAGISNNPIDKDKYIIVFSRYNKDLQPMNSSAITKTLIAFFADKKNDYIKNFAKFIDEHNGEKLSLKLNDEDEDEEE